MPVYHSARSRSTREKHGGRLTQGRGRETGSKGKRNGGRHRRRTWTPFVELSANKRNGAPISDRLSSMQHYNQSDSCRIRHHVGTAPTIDQPHTPFSHCFGFSPLQNPLNYGVEPIVNDRFVTGRLTLKKESLEDTSVMRARRAHQPRSLLIPCRLTDESVN